MKAQAKVTAVAAVLSVDAATNKLLDATAALEKAPTTKNAAKVASATKALATAKATPKPEAAPLAPIPADMLAAFKKAVKANDNASKALKDVLAQAVAFALEHGYTRAVVGGMLAASLGAKSLRDHSRELSNAWNYAAKDVPTGRNPVAPKAPASNGDGDSETGDGGKPAKATPGAGLPTRDQVAAFMVRANVTDAAALIADAFSSKQMADLMEALTEIAMSRPI